MRTDVVLMPLGFVTLVAQAALNSDSLRGKLLEDTTHEKHFEIHMPEAKPKKRDDYLCSAFGIKDLTRGEGDSKVYVTGFNVSANSSEVGHVAIVRCNKASIREGKVYNCGLSSEICGSASIQPALLYGWAKDAGPISLPRDVGFEVDVDNDQIVMEVHYKVPLNFMDKTSAVMNYTENKPKYNAGMMLLQKGQFSIPAGDNNVHAEINCMKVQGDLTLFAFMTHTHGLGADISGYISHKGDDNEFARGDPQKPQTFHQMEHFQVARKGDMVGAKCTFDGTRANKTTKIGHRDSDAMCNLFVMYYFDHDIDSYMACIDDELIRQPWTQESSNAFGATIMENCNRNCMEDCMVVGNGDKEGTHCTMVFGNGPNGLGWYGSDDNGSDQLGSPMPVRTCHESCEATCNIICMVDGEAHDGEVVAEDRWFGYSRRGYW